MTEPRSTRGSKAKPLSVPPHIVGAASELSRRPPPNERVLIAAEKVWSERGYTQTSVEDVLRVADVSRATFYQHYSGKEEVAAALFDRAIGFLLAAANARTVSATTVAEKVSLALEVYLELWQQHGRLVQELSLEALRPGSKLGPMRKRAVEAAVAVIGETFYQDRGKRLAPMAILHVILGVEAVLMHLQIEEPLTDATRGTVHASIVPLVLATLGEKP